MVRGLVWIAAMMAPFAVHAQPVAGATYEIVIVSEAAEQDNRGSTSSSFDRDTLAVRVIDVRDGGMELEYDLPASATTQDRMRSWQFPARVFRPHAGPTRLLNTDELKGRADAWLKAASLPREACGQWYFTWNAFRVECDPLTVVDTIAAFDMWPADLREGAPYRADGALGSAPLQRRAGASGSAIFTVELKIDPEAVRKGLVDADRVVAQINRKPITEEAARARHADAAISGTVSITFETDASGQLLRRTRVVKIETRRPGGVVENRTVRTVTEIRPVRRPIDDRMV